MSSVSVAGSSIQPDFELSRTASPSSMPIAAASSGCRRAVCGSRLPGIALWNQEFSERISRMPISRSGYAGSSARAEIRATSALITSCSRWIRWSRWRTTLRIRPTGWRSA